MRLTHKNGPVISLLSKRDLRLMSCDHARNGAQVLFYAGGYQKAFLPFPGVTGTLNWVKIPHTFTTPATSQVDNWYLRLKLIQASGSVWCDLL